MKPTRTINKKLLAEVRKLKCTAGVNCIGVIEAHHVTTKGAGGGDEFNNVMPLCTRHHKKLHDVGYHKALTECRPILQWLLDHGRMDIIERAKAKGKA